MYDNSNISKLWQHQIFKSFCENASKRSLNPMAIEEHHSMYRKLQRSRKNLPKDRSKTGKGFQTELSPGKPRFPSIVTSSLRPTPEVDESPQKADLQVRARSISPLSRKAFKPISISHRFRNGLYKFKSPVKEKLKTNLKNTVHPKIASDNLKKLKRIELKLQLSKFYNQEAKLL